MFMLVVSERLEIYIITIGLGYKSVYTVSNGRLAMSNANQGLCSSLIEDR